MNRILRRTLSVFLIIMLLAQTLSVFAADTLSKGDKGDEVKTLQRMLNSVNNAGLEVDGSFGTLTEAAVKEYQRLKGIASDGVYGPLTKAALESDYENIKLDFIWPLLGTNTYITSYYGGRIHPITGNAQNHSGIDISAPKGSEVLAAEGGVLKIGCNTCTHNYGKNSEQMKKCGCGNNYGNYVYIQHPDGMQTLYAHLTSIIVADGTSVAKGQQIATVGSTGRSTGFHLHFEVKTSSGREDPLDHVSVPSFIEIAEGNYSPDYVEQGSGYFLNGKISSIYALTEVTIEITYPNGTPTGQKKTAKPYTKSYDIEGIDAYIHFGKLALGDYLLKITASDGSGASAELVNKPFSVKSKIEDGLLEAFSKTKTYNDTLFTDVDKNQWYVENVSLVYETGLMEGKGKGIFAPSGNITLAEAVTVAARIYSIYHNEPINTSASSGLWYQPYVDFALKNGIFTQVDGDMTKAATRAQLAGMVANAISTAELEPINQVEDIPDVKNGDENYTEILLLYRAGVLNGADAQGNFMPQKSVTRAETAAMLSRLISPQLRMK